jgi:hypothetical protein
MAKPCGTAELTDEAAPLTPCATRDTFLAFGLSIPRHWG